MRKFEYVIIGAGSAGLSARREIAKKSDSWAVIDDGILGTTCARVGCMPSKVLIQVAEDFYRKHKFEEQGIELEGEISIDKKRVMEHVRKLRDRFVRAVMGGMSSWKNEKNFISKKATFIDANTLDVEGESICFDKAVIATGSKPYIPEMFKNYQEYIITTDEFFEMDSLPESMAIIGTGVIGIELGQALSKLGVSSIMIARRRMIAGISDPILREYVCDKFEQEYSISYEGVSELKKVNEKLCITTGGKDYLVDKVLMTTGRKPNLEKLGLEKLGIDHKNIDVCKSTFSIQSHPHLYLPGDGNGDKPILHEASDEGKIAGVNAIFNNQKPFQTRTPLEITFSDPNIIKAGKSFEVLTQNKIDFEIGQVSFEGQGRSIIKLKEIGMLRVYGDKKTGLILGAEGFGPSMEHIAHLLSWLIEMKVSVNKALSFPFYHPVIEEGLRTALRDLRSKVDEDSPYLEIFEKGK